MSITWNTGMAAERFRSKRKQKSEPPVDRKLILKLHNEWAKANGYKPRASSSKRQAASFKRQAPRKRHNDLIV